MRADGRRVELEVIVSPHSVASEAEVGASKGWGIRGTIAICSNELRKSADVLLKSRVPIADEAQSMQSLVKCPNVVQRKFEPKCLLRVSEHVSPSKN